MKASTSCWSIRKDQPKICWRFAPRQGKVFWSLAFPAVLFQRSSLEWEPTWPSVLRCQLLWSRPKNGVTLNVQEFWKRILYHVMVMQHVHLCVKPVILRVIPPNWKKKNYFSYITTWIERCLSAPRPVSSFEFLRIEKVLRCSSTVRLKDPAAHVPSTHQMPWAAQRPCANRCCSTSLRLTHESAEKTRKPPSPTYVSGCQGGLERNCSQEYLEHLLRRCISWMHIYI